MENHELRTRLLKITALASEYCAAVEQAAESERDDFIASMLNYLPRLYVEFFDLAPEERRKEDDEDNGADLDEYSSLSLEEDYDVGEYYGSYVDEDYYESVRRHMETLMGPDDTYLETFEDDMKYSDTPIAASVAESLADIFQALYNFISVVKDTDGEQLEGAYKVCHEAFREYWSQSLCNVLRALNHIYMGNRN